MHIFDNLKQYDKRYNPKTTLAPNTPIEPREKDDTTHHNLPKEDIKELRKERINKWLNGIGVISFFLFLIGGSIALAHSDIAQTIIIGGGLVIAILFIIFSVYVIFSNPQRKRWKNILYAVIIGIIIIGIILLLGAVLPESSINDAHRPDSFR